MQYQMTIGRYRRGILMVVLSGILLLPLSGCGEADQTGVDAAGKPGDETGTTSTGADYDPVINPDDFVSTIDNRYYPLAPGTTYIYEGETEEGAERNEVTVTSDTRTVMGVECVVVHDRVWLKGELIEETYDWYAQDRDGNVWYFGEDVDNYENGVLANHDGAWEAGKDGARPGYIMKAEVARGDSWRQEYLIGEAEDMGEIIGLGESVAVRAGSFQSCVRTRDWTPLEPEIEENKLYCPQTGMVFEEMTRGGTGRMELVEIKKG